MEQIIVTETEYIAPEGYKITQADESLPKEERLFISRKTVLPTDNVEEWTLMTDAEVADYQENGGGYSPNWELIDLLKNTVDKTGMIVKIRAGGTAGGVTAPPDRDMWALIPERQGTADVLEVAYVKPSSVGGYGSMFSGMRSVKDFSVAKTFGVVKAMNNLFAGCSNAEVLDWRGMDTSAATSIAYICRMYGVPTKLRKIIATGLDFSNLQTTTHAFWNCYKLEEIVGIDGWDVSNVYSLSGAFRWCTKLRLHLPWQNTSNLTDLERTFEGVIKVTGLRDWDTSHVTNMTCTFWGGMTEMNGYLDIYNWSTAANPNTNQMFAYSPLRFINVGPNFFISTEPLHLEGSGWAGYDEDGNDNGWLAHLATVAPEITDGQARTIVLSSSLKKKPFAAEYIALLQAKGYTIA